MKVLELLFLLTTFVSIFFYYGTAQLSSWSQRNVIDIATAYWNASLSIIWGIAALTLRDGSPVSFAMIIPIIPTTLIYGRISEYQDMQFNLTGYGITPTSIAVLSVVSVLVFLFIVAIIYSQRQASISSIVFYFVPAILFLLWSLSWLGFNSEYVVNMKAYGRRVIYKGKYSYHLHHWMIGIIGFLIARYPSIWSDVVAGIFWGVFCQAVAAYSIEIPVDFQHIRPVKL